MKAVLLALPLFAVLSLGSATSWAGGVIGDAIRGVGRATGIKPIEKLGKGLDDAHRDVKNAVPAYRAVEEGSSEFVRRSFTMACAGPFQALTNAVIARCSNRDGRLDDQHLIRQASDLLVRSGFFRAEEFNGVQIRWCPLHGAHGMAPDRGRIYLDSGMKHAHPIEIASLLAHEMTHVRQYRRLGTDRFKCEYSRQLVECVGCQDRRHALEREAYAFEDQVYQRLAASVVQPRSPTQASLPVSGQITIANRTSDRVVFYLVSDSTSRTEHWLGPNEVATFSGGAGDRHFDIFVYSVNGNVAYGLVAGGRYFLDWNDRGVLDVFR